jgi:type II secretory pathway pseudopilin PulG
MFAVTIGSILLLAVFNSASSMYRASVSGESQVLANNMAQQVIDNARNSSYDHLYFQIHQQQPPANGNGLAPGTVTQTLSLYDYPTSPSNPLLQLFPRPLLRNLNASAGLTYSTATTRQAFPGTVTETLTELSQYDTTNYTGQIKVTVNVSWRDNTGPHQYTTSTTISQSGIHN